MQPKKRILFVDDEPHILDGLKRMLRVYREHWEMEFVPSGAAALEAMDAAPFDVVVTDMRMPGMDGAELLKRAQRAHPRTVRIVLSGHADLEAAMRSVCISHQFLSKPCDAEVLRSVVERACRLAELLDDQQLQHQIGRIGDLPVLPKTYRALVEALGEPEVDLPMVGRIIEQDASVAVKILQLVNSSYFGLRREVTSVEQATTYLGVATIRDLVLTVEVFRQFEQSSHLPGFSLEREHRHSILVSRIARGMTKSDKRLSEQASVAGMLHDIGVLVLASQVPEEYGRVLRAAAAGEGTEQQLEFDAFGVTHAEVGAYLLGLWGMPYPVVEAVARHHRPSSVDPPSELGVLGALHVADFLANEVTGTQGSELDENYLSALGSNLRLDEWRAIAQAEAGESADAA